eukprot:558828_1
MDASSCGDLSLPSAYGHTPSTTMSVSSSERRHQRFAITPPAVLAVPLDSGAINNNHNHPLRQSTIHNTTSTNETDTLSFKPNHISENQLNTIS